MLPEKITREMFDKLVALAALELDEEESEYLRTELNHQLAAVKELSEIPIDEDIEPSLHGINCQGNPPRPDEWQPFPRSRCDLSACARKPGALFLWCLRLPSLFRRGNEHYFPFRSRNCPPVCARVSSPLYRCLRSI